MLFEVPRDKSLRMGDVHTSSEPKNIFTTLVTETRLPEPSAALGTGIKPPEPSTGIDAGIKPPEPFATICTEVNPPERPVDYPNLLGDNLVIQEASKEADVVSNSREKKMPVVKIRVRQSAASSRAEEADNRTVERSQGAHHETDRGASSSVSVDAPQRNSAEAVSISNQNLEEVNLCHNHGSRMTASIGSAKFASESDSFGKELQCTAGSGKISAHPHPASPSIMQDNSIDTDAQKYASLQAQSDGRHSHDGGSLGMVVSPFRGKEKEKRKKLKREDHKGRRDDPEYLERKRLKKEKKRKEKEIAKLLSDEAKTSSIELAHKKEEPGIKMATVQLKPNEPSGSKVVVTKVETKAEPSEGSSARKLRIKIKNRMLTKL